MFIRAGGIYSDSRSTKEIMALAEAGHNIRVIGWDRTGEAAGKCQVAFKSIADRVSFEFFSLNTVSGSGIKNFTKFFLWFRFVEKTLSKCIEGMDWVHACDLDSGWPAYRVCRRTATKLVYDIFDYYIDSHSLPFFMRHVVEKMEISVINDSVATIICTEERREQIKKARPHKVVVIHNSPDITGINLGAPELWDYTYCGAFVEDRLLEEILQEYKKNKTLKVLFAGSGKYQRIAESCAREDNFEFLGKIPYSRVLELEAQTAVLSAIYNPLKRNHRLCAPNKFYEALALGKPVIVCRGTGIDKLVNEYNVGIVIDYDVQQFYRALEILLSDRQNRIEMGTRARKMYIEKYHWNIMKKRLLNIYD